MLQQFSLTDLLRLNFYIQKLHLILIHTQQLRNIVLKSDHIILQKPLLSRKVDKLKSFLTKSLANKI